MGGRFREIQPKLNDMENRFKIIDSCSTKGTLKHICDKEGEEFSRQFITLYPRLIRVNGKLKDVKPLDDAMMVCNALNLYNMLGKWSKKATKSDIMELFKKHGL